MLDIFKRFTKTAAKEVSQEAPTAQQEGDTEMSQTTEVANLAADDKTVELSNALAAKETQLAELQAKFAEIEAKLGAIETEKVSLAAQAKAVVMTARKEKLEAILGTEGAAPVLATLEDADDNTFNTMYAAFSANRDTESQSKMFKEEGVAAEVKTPVEEADTATRLAAKIAAQYNPEGK